MKEFDAISSHFFSRQVSDQWLVDRLFSYDLRQVEVRQIVHVYMDGRDDKDLQKYIKKFKNPNKKGSGGTYCQNPMRNNRELAVVYTLLGNQVVNLAESYKSQQRPESVLLDNHRLLLLAVFEVWENHKDLDFVIKKKLRLIDLISVMSYYIQGDWSLSNCAVCGSVSSKIDGSSTPCTVCAAQQARKALIRQQQAKDAVRI